MPISPLAVKQYLTAPRDDFTYLKYLPRKDIVDALLSLRPAPDISDLMLHQLVGLLLGISYPAFAFWFGMGTGKTIMTLRLLQYWHACGQMRKAIIQVPSNEAVYSWGNEIRHWKVPLPFAELDDDASYDKALKLLEMDEGLVLISYPGFRRLVSVEEDEIKRGDRTGKRKLRAKASALDAVCAGLQAAVWDESTEAKNHDSLTFKVSRAISKRVPIRYALAGRPFGRDPFDLWPQQYLIDHGASLGSTQGIFRAAFYEKKKRFFGGSYSFEYRFRADQAGEVSRLSRHRSLQYTTEECVDLPPLSRIRKRIPFPAETLVYYDKVVEHLISARGDKAITQGDFIRMRQLSSGFLGVANDEVGAKVEIEFDKNPKLDTLMSLLGQVPVGRKSVVWFEFIYSGQRISAALKKAHIKHSLVWSGTKDRREALRRFLEDPDYEVLVVNHQIGAYSLNLQTANYVFVYESAVGAIDRDQLERRCWRKGQTRRVFLYDLCMVDSVDERILEFHRQGNSIFDAITKRPDLLRRKRAEPARRPVAKPRNPHK